MGDRRDNTGSAPDDLGTLGDEERVLKIVTSSVLQLWDVVNNLTRLRPTTRQRYRVAGARDMTIPVCVEDGAGILSIIREHHAAWVATR